MHTGCSGVIPERWRRRLNPRPDAADDSPVPTSEGELVQSWHPGRRRLAVATAIGVLVAGWNLALGLAFGWVGLAVANATTGVFIVVMQYVRLARNPPSPGATS